MMTENAVQTEQSSGPDRKKEENKITNAETNMSTDISTASVKKFTPDNLDNSTLP